MLDVVLTGKVEHLTVAIEAGTRLKGSRLVVESRMYDAAVAARLVLGESGFFLNQHHLGLGVGLGNLERNRGTHDSAADQDKIKLLHRPQK